MDEVLEINESCMSGDLTDYLKSRSMKGIDYESQFTSSPRGSWMNSYSYLPNTYSN